MFSQFALPISLLREPHMFSASAVIVNYQIILLVKNNKFPPLILIDNWGNVSSLYDLDKILISHPLSLRGLKINHADAHIHNSAVHLHSQGNLVARATKN